MIASGTTEQDMSLLERMQILMEVERSLTTTLEQVEPWLTGNTFRPSSSNAFGERVRPIPTTMEQVEQILAVGRNLSSRTSAPAGWNPAAPVVGFSTPNPLPHQLRGGALAALQLERAHQEEHNLKRKKQQQDEEAQRAKTKKLAEQETTSSSRKTQSAPPGTSQPPQGAKLADNSSTRRATRPPPQALQTTMNLSDSSSEEDGDSDDD